MSENEYVVRVDDDLEKQLFDDFELGPILETNENGDMRMLTEVFVGKVKGAKIEIFSNEHPPPHFRVFYQGSSANYTISNCDRINGDGQLQTFEKNIKKWWKNNKDRLIEIWNERRPSDCPVGPYRE